MSDGIIAPGYAATEALEILKTNKRKGSYNIVQVDPDYVPAAARACKDVFGVTFEQGHNNCRIDEALLEKHRDRRTTTCPQAPSATCSSRSSR